jgi:hypothetical protein
MRIYDISTVTPLSTETDNTRSNQAVPSSVNILSPNGSEVYYTSGAPMRIGFRQTGLNGSPAKITMSRPGQSVSCTLKNTTLVNDIDFVDVDLKQGCLNSNYGQINSASDYKVNITVEGPSQIQDSSDNYFTITNTTSAVDASQNYAAVSTASLNTFVKLFQLLSR